MPKFSVIIPSSRTGTISSAIVSIQRQTLTDWELIVVGQGADGDLRSLIESIAQDEKRVRYEHIQMRGAGRARNAGMLSAQGELLVFTDDDCEARPDWLSVIGEIFESEPEVDVVSGSLLIPPVGHRRLAVCPSFYPPEALYEPVSSNFKAPEGFSLVGANLGLRRRAVEKVGMFDEWLGPGTEFPVGEDSDYLRRLELSDVPMRSTPRAAVVHQFGVRYGVGALLQLQRNYARGNGGAAGKWTLLGDARGAEWLERERRSALRGWLHPLRPWKALRNWRHYYFFSQAYRDCLGNYGIDRGKQLLVRKKVHGALVYPASLVNDVQKA